MKDEPYIVKMLREAGKYGRLQSRVTSNIEELDTVEEPSEEVPEKTVGFIDDDVERKSRDDVTKSEGLGETTEESEDRYRLIFENINDEIVYLDKHGKILDVNNRVEDIFGQKREDIIGKNFTKLGFFGIKDLPRMIKLFKDIVMDDKTIDRMELESKHKDGHKIFIDVNIRPIRKNGETEAILCIIRDITERKKKEEELIRFSNAVKMSTDSIVISDLDAKIIDVNEATLQMYGTKDKRDLIGKNSFDLITSEGREKALAGAKEVLEKGYVKGREYHIITEDGDRIPVEMSVSIMKDRDGKPIGFVGLSRDITERKKAEEKIRRQNIKLKRLDRIKSNFLSVTSHELRTPMSAIKGYIQMLLKQRLGDVTPEQKDALDAVLRNTNRLDNLIEAILDISRLESGTMKFLPEQTDISKMIKEVTETMQANTNVKNIKINTELEELPELVIDQQRIKQVLMNLVDNAIKFSPHDSTINLCTKMKKDDVLFEIRDFGRGIPKKTQKKIFERFYQVDSGMDRKFGGVGLGLSISKGIIQAHGGDIWVESTMGKGSTFRFTLPLEPARDIEKKFKDLDIFGLEKK